MKSIECCCARPRGKNEGRSIGDKVVAESPLTASASCTDIPCFLVFVLFLSGMVYLAVNAHLNTDLRRLTHGVDYLGQLCGVDAAVKDKPRVYFCSTGEIDGVPMGLDTQAPVCIASCPLGNETDMITCNSSQPTPVYATVTILGIYCMPDMEKITTVAVSASQSAPVGLRNNLTAGVGPIGAPVEKFVKSVGSLKRCQFVLIGACILAIILGFVYLCMLKTCAEPLVYMSLLLLVVLFSLISLFFILGELAGRPGAIQESAHVADPVTTQNSLDQRWNGFEIRENYEKYNPFYREYMSSADARICSFVTGAVFGVLAFVLICLACCARQSIKIAVSVIEVAVKCIFDNKAMLLMPLMDALGKVIVFVVLLFYFMLLVAHAVSKGGMGKKFDWGDQQMYHLLYFLFGIFWILEVCTALGQFTISYAVVQWYFTPKNEKDEKPDFRGCSALGWGYVYGLTKHLGTLALGAFLVAVCRIIIFFLDLAKESGKSSGGPGGAAVACIACIVQCCCECVRKCIEHINKNAYIDVAITSSSFCIAAKHVFEFIAKQAKAITILHGACFIFTVIGILAISGLTGLMTYLVVTTDLFGLLQGRWTADDSLNHIYSPRFVAIVTMVIAAFIAHTFMLVFDHTADTLLYTYCWNLEHGRDSVDKYAPTDLVKITQYASLDEDEKSKTKDGME